MTEPLVSVKMITYNHAPYIAKAIEGVFTEAGFPKDVFLNLKAARKHHPVSEEVGNLVLQAGLA